MNITNRFFSGAARYGLPEEEMSFVLEHILTKASPLYETYKKRIEFKEQILNEIGTRIGWAHAKIQLITNELTKHYTSRQALLDATMPLEAEILQNAIHANLLETTEVIKQFAFLLKEPRYSKKKGYFQIHFAFLFHRLSKEELKSFFNDEKQVRQYDTARTELFPSLAYDLKNVPERAFFDLGDKLLQKANKLITFRNKIIAHKFDVNRFSIALTYEEYDDIYKHVVHILDAVAIVAALQPNNWMFLTHFVNDSHRTKDWIQKGLSDSL